MMDKELQESREKASISGRTVQVKPQEGEPENTIEVSKDDYDKEKQEVKENQDAEVE